MNRSINSLASLALSCLLFVACDDNSSGPEHSTSSSSSSSDNLASSSSQFTSDISTSDTALLDTTIRYEWKSSNMVSDMIIGRKAQVHFSSCVTINKKLTIREGARLFFDENACLLVMGADGKLLVEGTSTDSVYFVPAQSGKFWGGGTTYGAISVLSSAATGSSIAYAVIDSATTGILLERENGLDLSHTAVRNSKEFGIKITGDNALHTNGMTSIHFQDNGIGAIATAKPDNLLHMDSSLSFSGNGAKIILQGGSFTQSGTIPSLTAPYVVQKAITASHTTKPIELTIAAGSQWLFYEQAYLAIGKNAKLHIAGEKSASVRMNTAEPGKFFGIDGALSNAGGIRFSADALAESSIEFLELDSAENGIIVKRENGLSIHNSAIAHCAKYGLYLSADNAIAAEGIADNQFSENGLHHIYATPSSIINMAHNTFSGTNQGILLRKGTIDKTASLTKQDVPYYVTGQIIVKSSTQVISLTIEPGVHLLFNTDSYLQFDGGAKLLAKGTATDSVFFTNAVAGSYWGKGTSGSSNSYSGLDFSTIGNELQYVVIDGAWTGIYNDKASVTVSNSSIRNCMNYGIYKTSAASSFMELTDVSFSNNGIAGKNY